MRSLPFSYVRVMLAQCLALAVALMPVAGAQAFTQSQSAHHSLGLDLSSTNASVFLQKGMVHGEHVLNVGGSSMTVGTGSRLTPAEFMALEGLLATGHQTLTLDAQGQAIGGLFTLPASLSRLGTLNIPAGVTAVAATGNSPLAVAGSLVDSGSLIGLGGSLHNFIVNAGQLNVNAGGLLTTILPDTLTGFAASKVPVSLSLFSMGDINNAGTISASGHLNVWSGGSITNASQMTGGTGVNVFASTGNINNAGVISALNGNVLLNTITPADLLVNNIGGQILANNGVINFRLPGFAGTADTTLLGGLLSANAVNFNAGCGLLTANADQINGIVNVTAKDDHVTVNTGTLNLGTMNVSGDPTFVNTTGDIQLTQNLTFPGQDVAILAAGDITAANNVTSINLSSTNAHGGSLTIIAGANITTATGPSQALPPTGNSADSYTVTGFNSNGGNVLLPYVRINTSSSTASTNTANNAAGSVTVAASNGGVANGTIQLGSIAAASRAGNGGNILIEAPFVSTYGGIDTHTTGSGSSTVAPAAGNITVESGTVTFSSPTSPTYTNGSLTAGSVTVGGSIYSPGTVTIGDTVKNNGVINLSAPKTAGSLTLIAGEDVTVSNSITGNATNAASGVSSPMLLESINSSVIVNGKISSRSPFTPNASGVDIEATNGSVEVAKGIQVGGGIAVAATGVKINALNLINIGYNLTSVNPLPLISQGGINTSGPAPQDVLLTCTAGDIRVAQGINASASSGNSGRSVRLNAGGIIRIDGPVNVSSKGSGGNVNLTANGGDELTGIEVKGLINTSGAGSGGGRVSVTADNGAVFLRGGITDTGKGDVNQGITISSGYDLSITGNIIGSESPTTQPHAESGSTVVLSSSNGQVSVSGTINTTSTATTGTAGTVSISAYDGITTGAITAQSVSGFGTPVDLAGDDVSLQTADGAITVKGTINTSTFTSRSNDVGNAGQIAIGTSNPSAGAGPFGPASVSVLGNIITTGGSAPNNNPGNAGNITIDGRSLGANLPTIGSIVINGFISAKGGNTSFAPQGGQGGTVTLDGATVQIKGSSIGASVNVSGGAANGAPTRDGNIAINSYGIQPLTTDFNLPSTKHDQAVLPGALFLVGNSAVNGTTGALVAGSSKVASKGYLLATETSASNITVDTAHVGGAAGVASLTVSGIATPFTVTTKTTDTSSRQGTLASFAPREFATPAESLALLQESTAGGTPTTGLPAGGTQTIGLTSTGAADSKQANGTSGNLVTIDAGNFGRPISLFNLSTAVVGSQPFITLNIDQSDNNDTRTVDVPIKTGVANVINGTLTFVDTDGNATSSTSKYGRLDIGTKLTVGFTGTIGTSSTAASPVPVLLDIRGSGSASTLVNNGIIKGDGILIRNESGALTLSLGDSSTTGGNTLGDSLILSAASGTSLNSALNIKVTAFATTAPQIVNSNVYLYGSSITVGSFSTSSFTTLGPDFGATVIPSLPAKPTFSTLVVTESKFNTTIAGSTDLNYTGTFLAGGAFTSSSGGNFNMTNATFQSSGAMQLVTEFSTDTANPPTFGVGTFTNTSLTSGKTLFVYPGTLQDTAGTNRFTSAGTMTVQADDHINLNNGTNIFSAGRQMNLVGASGAAPDINFAGSISAGTASTSAPDPNTNIQGLSHSMVKSPGQIAVFTTGPIAFSAGTSLSSFGGNLFVQSGDSSQSPGVIGGPLAPNVTLGNGSVFAANGGNVSITSDNNVTGGASISGAPGNTFSARGFSTGGGGGVEVLSGTFNTFVASKIAARPVPLKEVNIPGTPGSPVSIQIIDPGVGDKKGLIDMTGVTSANLTGVTTINFYKSVVLLQSLTTGTTVTLDTASVTAIDPVADKQVDRADEFVVDTEDDVEQGDQVAIR